MTLAFASKARSAVIDPTVSVMRSTLLVSVGFSGSTGEPGVWEDVMVLRRTPLVAAVCCAGIWVLNPGVLRFAILWAWIFSRSD